MKRLFFWATILSGAAAAYMMYKRGESFGNIAKKSLTDPMGSFVSEMKTT